MRYNLEELEEGELDPDLEEGELLEGEPRLNPTNDDYKDEFRNLCEMIQDHDRLEESKEFIQRHPDVVDNKITKSKQTPLLLAMNKDNVELVKWLIGTMKVNPNQLDRFGYNLLYILLSKIESGESKNISFFRYLVDHVDVNYKAENGMSLLEFILINEFEYSSFLLSILLKKNPDIDSKFILRYIRLGFISPKLFSIVVKHIPITTKIIWKLVYEKNVEYLKIVLSHTSLDTINGKYDGITIWFLLAKWDDLQQLNQVVRLLYPYLSLDALTTVCEGSLILQTCVTLGNSVLFSELIRFIHHGEGISREDRVRVLSLPDSFGKTVLQTSLEVIDQHDDVYFFKKCFVPSNCNERYYGETPLLQLIKLFNIHIIQEIITFILQKEVLVKAIDWNARNNDGDTILHIAVRRNLHNIIHLLLHDPGLKEVDIQRQTGLPRLLTNPTNKDNKTPDLIANDSVDPGANGALIRQELLRRFSELGHGKKSRRKRNKKSKSLNKLKKSKSLDKLKK
jgi:ankyrin repeat protein